MACMAASRDDSQPFLSPFWARKVSSRNGVQSTFEIAGSGCLVKIGEDEPRYATVAEIAARLEPHSETTMVLTAVSEAVERYDPSTEAAILLETASGYQVLILSPEGYDYVGGLTFEGYGLLGLTRG
jgi:hypothetical protein